jgi:hypothetical protein
LDDLRVPLILGIKHVRNYDEFVAYIEANGVPELVCFDHDLAPEHYPLFENRPGMKIPYDTYKEKTGRECARYLINKNLPVKYWSVHTLNAQGGINIREEMRAAYPQGELRGLDIPFYVPD